MDKEGRIQFFVAEYFHMLIVDQTNLFHFTRITAPRSTDLTLGFFGCGIFGTRNGPHTSNRYCGKRGRHYRFGIYLPFLLAGGPASPAAKLVRLVV